MCVFVWAFTKSVCCWDCLEICIQGQKDPVTDKHVDGQPEYLKEYILSESIRIEGQTMISG